MPPQAVQETKALLNHALKSAVAAVLPHALTVESASFDEPAFRAKPFRGGRHRAMTQAPGWSESDHPGARVDVC